MKAIKKMYESYQDFALRAYVVKMIKSEIYKDKLEDLIYNQNKRIKDRD